MREKNPAGPSRQTKSRPEQVGVNCFLILPGAPLATPPFRTFMIVVSSFPQRLLRTVFFGFLLSTAFRSAEASPTAVNDSYSTAEDTPLAVAGIMVVGTGFE